MTTAHTSATPSTPPQLEDRPLVEAAAIADTAGILQQLAAADHGLDGRRGEVSAALAALVATVGRRYHSVPADVAQRLAHVVRAVDAATGYRR
ncbi:MAG: hypothetical protein J0I49_14760 [Pseudonocardia sp.]|jgi:hypothetical protein|uniref:hypothetical protein n=1 Tax=Pseudonocardia sp. TaxID=60912 RepID=UPI001AD51E37|nr:hypothetical protein [Pseudonocardia sp.]MBN9099355.1 hypothetical protein [Pseudonocardia sp.]